MSYILSALKKAERERQRGKAPDLLSDNSGALPMSKTNGRSKVYWFLFGIVTLIVANVLIHGWMTGTLKPAALPWLDTRGQAVNHAPVAGGEETKMREDVAVMPKSQTSAPAPILSKFSQQSASLSESRSVAAPQQATLLPESKTPPLPTHNHLPQGNDFYVPELMGLDPDIRDSIPPLQLTGHLYSLAHVRARKVIVNGVSLRERQYLIDDLFVNEITPDGVVFNFRGHLFRLHATQMFQ